MNNNSGILIIDKPIGISTNQLIQKIKRKFKIQKIGHAGTLDPLANGVVICLVNKATRLSDFLLTEDKTYIVTMKLFQSTTTQDLEGEITKTQKPFKISETEIQETFKKYHNYSYHQTPPIFSAIKVKGKKLYQYALENKEVEIIPRKITIKKIKILKIESDQIQFETTVSKGTYIRSLIVDLAKELDTIAHVTNLTRIKSGNFELKNAKQWDDILESDLIPIKTALTIAKQPIYYYENIDDIKNGRQIILKNCVHELVFISDHQEQIIACYKRLKNDIFISLRGGFI